ncbi:hypothetical protein EJB05_33086, partial [Eragrostis curvula]
MHICKCFQEDGSTAPHRQTSNECWKKAPREDVAADARVSRGDGRARQAEPSGRRPRRFHLLKPSHSVKASSLMEPRSGRTRATWQRACHASGDQTDDMRR